MSTSVTIKIDKTLPTAPVGTPARSANANGWYNASIGVSFTATDTVSGLKSCIGGVYNGPDSASASVPGTCEDNAGNLSSSSFSFKYDASAPGQPTATAARGPDVNGWYNQSLSVSFAASDVGPSGIESCSAPSYSGPDSATASVSGVCTDRAGNVSLARSFGFKYDDTAPQTVASLDGAANANGWYRAPLRISFRPESVDVSGAACDPDLLLRRT